MGSLDFLSGKDAGESQVWSHHLITKYSHLLGVRREHMESLDFHLCPPAGVGPEEV